MIKSIFLIFLMECVGLMSEQTKEMVVFWGFTIKHVLMPDAAHLSILLFMINY